VTVQSTVDNDELFNRLGRRLRDRRLMAGMTQRELAKVSGLSLRFLSQLERGQANVSVGKLASVCGGLGLSLSDALEGLGPEPTQEASKIALLGMRGAGKSTVGPLLAERFGGEFVELDEEVERAAGMKLSELFELSGRNYYRGLEREAFERLLDRPEMLVIATGGSIVMDPTTFDLLRSRTRTVWLRASPDDHWDRVVKQGDTRPMRGVSDAKEQLRRLLEVRVPFYGMADIAVDTTLQTPADLADEVARRLGPPAEGR